MKTKSKRHLNRSQSVTRAPRHYSKIISDDIFINIGLCIVGAIVVFLVIVFLSAMLG